MGSSDLFYLFLIAIQTVDDIDIFRLFNDHHCTITIALSGGLTAL